MAVPRVPTMALLGVAAALAIGCAGKTARAPHVREVPDARLMQAAAVAHRDGRVAEALTAYQEVTARTAAPATAREAWFEIGLLHLGGRGLPVDPGAAEAALRAARSLYGATDQPPVLAALLTVLEQWREARGAVSTSHLSRDRQLAVREEELRAARRTMAQLRQDLERRDAALKKAADAALGAARRR